MSPKTKLEIQFELDQIDSLLRTYAPAFDRARSNEPDIETLTIIASALHSLYNGIENILKRTMLDSGTEVPSGPTSHAELLSLAAGVRGGGKSLISEDLFGQLKPLLAFRHFYRHSYSFVLEWARLKEIALAANEIATRFHGEMALLLEP